MPHLIIEYSKNLSALVREKNIITVAHQTMIESNLFTVGDIKTREYSTEDFLVGLKGKDSNFIHITIYLLEGRTIQQKQKLTSELRDKILPQLENVQQFSVDIRDMVKETYIKYSL